MNGRQNIGDKSSSYMHLVLNVLVVFFRGIERQILKISLIMHRIQKAINTPKFALPNKYITQ